MIVNDLDRAKTVKIADIRGYLDEVSEIDRQINALQEQRERIQDKWREGKDVAVWEVDRAVQALGPEGKMRMYARQKEEAWLPLVRKALKWQTRSTTLILEREHR